MTVFSATAEPLILWYRPQTKNVNFLCKGTLLDWDTNW